MKIEIRADNSVHIEGYVNAVERDSNEIIVPTVGRCVEQIRAGAFGQALGSGADVDILENHSRKLGSISQGNLSLHEDSIGLHASTDITDEDIVGKARRGELKGWSFGFVCTDSEIEQRAGNVPRRIVKALSLSEVSLIDGAYKPCYNGTLVEVRSEGDIIEYRGGIDEVVEVETDADSTEIENDVEERAEEVDYSYYDAMLRYLELRYNPYHDPGNGRFTSGGGGGGGSVLVIPEGHKGVYTGYKKAMQKSISSASDLAAERVKAMGGYVDEYGNFSFAEHGGLKMNMGLANSAPTETIDVKTGLTSSSANDIIETEKTTGKTVRDNGSSLYNAIGHARYEEVCQQIDNCQNKNLQQLYRNNINNMDVSFSLNNPGSHQKNGSNKIELNELGENHTAGRERNSVIFHEGAHAIDNQLGGGGANQYYSLSWNNGSFMNSLQSEINDYVNARNNRLKSEYETQKNNAEWLRKNVVPTEQGKQLSDEVVVAAYGNRKYTKSIAYTSIKNEVHKIYEGADNTASHQAGCVSDIFGLGTNNKAKNGMGHNDKYAQKSDFSLPVETFAEFSECTISGHTDIIKSYFPKSYAQYEQMLTDGAAK